MFQLRGSGTKRFLKRFLVAEVLQQLPTDTDLTVGISLANNGSDIIDQGSTINSIKEGKGVSAGELDVGIYIPVELLKGIFVVPAFARSDIGGQLSVRFKCLWVRPSTSTIASTIEDKSVTHKPFESQFSYLD